MNTIPSNYTWESITLNETNGLLSPFFVCTGHFDIIKEKISYKLFPNRRKHPLCKGNGYIKIIRHCWRYATMSTLIQSTCNSTARFNRTRNHVRWFLYIELLYSLKHEIKCLNDHQQTILELTIIPIAYPYVHQIFSVFWLSFLFRGSQHFGLDSNITSTAFATVAHTFAGSSASSLKSNIHFVFLLG